MLTLALLCLPLYGLVAYLFLPFFWRHFERQPQMSVSPAVTRTGDGIPGDPLNVGLVGSETTLRHALHEAGWLPADPLELKSLWGMAKAVALQEPYPTAPVSNLYLFGRKEDLAFEQAAGPTLTQRHHVRFWRADELAPPGTPFWIGAATFDVRIGFSRYTGQILHHIAPDVDAERGRLLQDLDKVGRLSARYTVSGVGPTLNGRNGEGDWYYTDGDVHVGVLSSRASPGQTNPTAADPASIAVKNRLWQGLRRLLGWLPGTGPH